MVQYTITSNNIKTNYLITSKYPVKYSELVFVSTNFEITILSKLTSQMLFFCSIKFFFCYFCSKVCYSSSDFDLY